MVMIAWPPALTSGGAVPPPRVPLRPLFRYQPTKTSAAVWRDFMSAILSSAPPSVDHSQFNGQFARIRGVRRRVYRAGSCHLKESRWGPIRAKELLFVQ